MSYWYENTLHNHSPRCIYYMHQPRVSCSSQNQFNHLLYHEFWVTTILFKRAASCHGRCTVFRIDPVHGIQRSIYWNMWHEMILSLPSRFHERKTIKILPFAKRNFFEKRVHFPLPCLTLKECEIGKKSGSKCRDTMWKKTVLNIIQLILGILSTHVFLQIWLIHIEKHPCFVAKSSLFFSKYMLHLGKSK